MMKIATILMLLSSPAWAADACGGIDFSGGATSGLDKVGFKLQVDPQKGQMLVAGGDTGSQLYFKDGQWCLLSRHKEDGKVKDDKEPLCGDKLYKAVKEAQDGYSISSEDENADKTDPSNKGKERSARLQFEPGPNGEQVPVIRPTDKDGNLDRNAGYVRLVRQSDDKFTNWDLQGMKSANGDCKSSLFAKLIFSQDKTGIPSSGGGSCNKVKFQGSPEIFANNSSLTSSSKGDDYTKTDVSQMCDVSHDSSTATRQGKTTAATF